MNESAKPIILFHVYIYARIRHMNNLFSVNIQEG